MNIRLAGFVFLTISTLTSLLASRSRRDVRGLRRMRQTYLDQIRVPNTISGSISGTAYYGTGSDPNYGHFGRPENRPSGIRPMSYDPNSNGFNVFANPSHTHLAFQPSGSNRWSGSSFNDQTGNRYSPGSPGWYATGGNYLYNNGNSLAVHSMVYFISALLLIITQSNVH